MNILADENVDRSIVERLRLDGHEVLYVAEMLSGLDDGSVMEEANKRGSLLLTADKDFGELVFRQGRAHSGVVLLRLAGLEALDKELLVSGAFRTHASELWRSFSVISPNSLRIRQKGD